MPFVMPVANCANKCKIYMNSQSTLSRWLCDQHNLKIMSYHVLCGAWTFFTDRFDDRWRQVYHVFTSHSVKAGNTADISLLLYYNAWYQNYGRAKCKLTYEYRRTTLRKIWQWKSLSVDVFGFFNPFLKFKNQNS